MKSKKSLRILSALVSLAVIIAAFSGITAFAAPVEYEAKAAIINERAALEVPVDYAVDKETKKAVSSSDISAVKVTSTDGAITYESDVKTDDGKGYKYSSGKITYYYSQNIEAGNQDEYNVTVTVKTSDTETVDITVTVKVYGKITDESSLSYVDGAKDLDMGATVTGSVSSRKLTIEFDNFLKAIESKYVDESLLKYTVYYQAPTSTTFSSTSEKTGALADISLSEEGIYRYYVLVKDPDGNAIKVTDLELKEDGYYDDEDNLIVPVYTYNYVQEDEDKAVSVTKKSVSSKNAKGRVNQRYQSISFEVKNAAYKKFVLYYRANSSAEWKEAENGVDANFTATSFSESQLYFTPLKKGEFKIVATVKGNVTDLEAKTAESDIVTVNEQVEELKLVDEKVKNFFKNNWLSVIFLGIAVLCLIGIVVIALWKPSDGKKADKKTEGEKEENATIAADETQTAETAEATEAPAENVEEASESTEEADETQTAEATENAAEETADENVAPAEESGENAETPAENNEDKPE